MNYLRIKKFLACIFFITTSLVMAQVSCPHYFSDHMVLQRETKANVWGWAKPKEKIVVIGSWGKTVETKANTTGEWEVKLETPKAGGPYELTIKGSNTLVYKNVMSGDVWFCSGQSNMHFSLNMFYDQNVIKEEATKTNIRFFTVLPNGTKELKKNVRKTSWKTPVFKNLKNLSATSFYFGKNLEENLTIPIGLVQSAWSGRRIEYFTPWSAQNKIDYLIEEKQKKDKITEEWDYKLAAENNKKVIKEWEDNIKQWEANGKKGHRPWKGKKMMLTPYENADVPSSIYNGMIHPCTKMTIKGFIWYQGETNGNLPIMHNAGDAEHYDDMMVRLISSWRKAWGDEKLPFYYVQLPDFRAPWQKPVEISQRWPVIRQSMLHIVNQVPHTGMAVTIGLGEEKNIHPHKKKEVGERLARWALNKTYGKNIAYSGPLAKSCEFKGMTAIITFDHGGDKLSFVNDHSVGFAIKDKSGKYHKANAEIISSNQLKITATTEIEAVYYAWADNPKGASLQNKASLPASPFMFEK